MRETVAFRLRPLSVFLLLLVAMSVAIQSCYASSSENPAEQISQLLQQLIFAPADTCGAPPVANLDPDQIEQSILEQAANLFLQELNQSGPELTAASNRATEALNRIKAESDKTNAIWPVESRFRYELLTIPPALVVKVGIGSHERYFAFGVPAKDDTRKPNRQWARLGEDELELENQVGRVWIDVYPLHRGPSGNPRFFASIGFSGCAGSSGLLYDAREWDPNDVVGLSQIIKQQGARGMDEDFNGANRPARIPSRP